MDGDDRIHFPAEPGCGFEERFHVLAVGRGTIPAARTRLVDNRRRHGPDGRPAAVFQLGLAGCGRYRDAAGEQRLAGPGWGLCVQLPSPSAYGNQPGMPWERVWLTLGGPVALELAQALAEQAGPVFRLAPQAAVAERLCALHARLERDELPTPVLAAEAHAILAAAAGALAPGDRAHPPPVVAALALLRRRLADPALRLEDLAAAAGMSRFHFSRCFAAAVGEPPMQHLTARRLRRAAAMLRHSRLAVKQIATACGYASRQRFSAAFAQRYGRSPQAWRRDG